MLLSTGSNEARWRDVWGRALLPSGLDSVGRLAPGRIQPPARIRVGSGSPSPLIADQVKWLQGGSSVGEPGGRIGGCLTGPSKGYACPSIHAAPSCPSLVRTKQRGRRRANLRARLSGDVCHPPSPASPFRTLGYIPPFSLKHHSLPPSLLFAWAA